MKLQTSTRKLLLWPCLVIPAAGALVTGMIIPLPRWIWMWLLVGSLWIGFKWMTFFRAGGFAKTRLLFFLWPGMEPEPFAKKRREDRVETVFPGSAMVFLAAGLVALLLLVPRLENTFAIGWIGMISILCFLHFGGFAILAWMWRRAGFPVKPIMNAPWAARDLADFWGPRWNRAFSDWARIWVFRPLVKRFGIAGGTMAGFLASGVAHEFVVSLPAGGGYGLPTLYFLLQGIALLAQKRFPVLSGSLPTLVFVFLPAPLLFHIPFCERVVAPMVEATLQLMNLH